MKLIDKLLDALSPPMIKCVICGREIDKSKHGICDKCMKEMPLNLHVCKKCGVDIRTMNVYCDTCGKNQLMFNEARSVCRFEGYAKTLVYRLKFGNHRYLADVMAHMMKKIFDGQHWLIDEITFIPISAETKRKRGYNQAKLLADSLGKLTGLPVVNLANKVRDLGPQEDKTYDERFADMAGIFEFAAKPKPNVLIVDDVKTTGATLNEMTKVLRENGCENVYCLTFASNVRKIPME